MASRTPPRAVSSAETSMAGHPYPLPRFDWRDYCDADDSSNEQDTDRQQPWRRPPVLHLHWMWLIIRFLSHALLIVSWIQHRLDQHNRAVNGNNAAAPAPTSSAFPATSTNGSRASGSSGSTSSQAATDAVPIPPLPVSSPFEVARSASDDRWAMDGLQLLLPSFLLTAAGRVDQLLLAPLFSFLQRLQLWKTDAKYSGVTQQRPLVYVVWMLSTALSAATDVVLSVLTAITGHRRSWANVFDDSFDIEYCVKELQPSYSAQPMSRSGLGDALQLPDRLFPYDRHATAGFAPVVTPLDVVTAFLSKLCYEELDLVQYVCSQWLPPGSFTLSDCTYDSRDAGLGGVYADVVFQSRAVLLLHRNAVVVAFRGTYPTSAIQWLTDFAAEQTVYPGQSPQLDPKQAVRVHRGFFTALGLPAVGDVAYPESLYTQLLRKLNQPPFNTAEHLYVTGHSLGAALACLFSYAVLTPPPLGAQRQLRHFDVRTQQAVTVSAAPSLPVEQHRVSESPPALIRLWLSTTGTRLRGVYTFGSPRVGNDSYCNEYDRAFSSVPVHRFINRDDLIPHLPPPLAGSYHERHVDFDYCHVDGLRYVSTGDGRVIYCVNQDAPPTPWIRLNIGDHFPGAYVRNINAALDGQIQAVWNVKMYNRLHAVSSAS